MTNRFVKMIHNFAYSKTANWYLLCGFFFIVAAAAHCGFMAKYSFNDSSLDTARSSFQKIMDGQANKPFVYRQLIPSIARFGEKLISETNIPASAKNYVLNKFDPHKSFSKATSANLAGYEFSYRIIYLSNFAALLASLFLLRSLTLRFDAGHFESILAPSAFILAFPYLQTLGGHFYDSAELAFFCGAVLLAIQGRLLALVLLTSFATLNKESFLFFLPALYPFLREKLDRKNTLAGLALAILVSGLLNAYVKFIFHQNPGDVAEIHFWENLKEYLLPWTYMRIEWTYGLPSPEGANLATLAFIFIIVVRGISQIAPAMKSHLLIAISINFPLFLVFCQTGELRNLSMMFVGFVVLMAGALKTVKSD